MDSKLKLEEEAKFENNQAPTHYIDEELNYVKEIRTAYFVLRKEDIPPAPPKKEQFPTPLKARADSKPTVYVNLKEVKMPKILEFNNKDPVII
jgi:hypothetical protein